MQQAPHRSQHQGRACGLCEAGINPQQKLYNSRSLAKEPMIGRSDDATLQTFYMPGIPIMANVMTATQVRFAEKTHLRESKEEGRPVALGLAEAMKASISDDSPWKARVLTGKQAVREHARPGGQLEPNCTTKNQTKNLALARLAAHKAYQTRGHAAPCSTGHKRARRGPLPLKPDPLRHIRAKKKPRCNA